MVENENRLEKTIQMFGQKYNYFDANERMTITPLSKLLFTVLGFCKCFDNTEKEYSMLVDLYNDPIKFILLNHKTNFPDRKKYQMSVRKTLGQLEWIFYRDSHRFTALKKEYSIDSRKPMMTKSITFDDLTAIRGYVEMEIQKVMVEVIKKNNVDIEGFNLPNVDSRVFEELGVNFGLGKDGQ